MVSATASCSGALRRRPLNDESPLLITDISIRHKSHDNPTDERRPGAGESMQPHSSKLPPLLLGTWCNHMPVNLASGHLCVIAVNYVRVTCG